MTPLMIFLYLAAQQDLLLEVLVWLPAITLVLKFLSAVCGFVMSLLLLIRKIRLWMRLRRRWRSPRA